MSESINFFKDSTKFKLEKRRELRKWINNVVNSEKCNIEWINFVFCDDRILADMNIKYLNHNTLTDILTFSFSDSGENISGEIYISVQRVRENASNYKVTFEKELHRVMIHGILHLLGYNDSTKEENESMRQKENFYLSFLFQ